MTPVGMRCGAIPRTLLCRRIIPHTFCLRRTTGHDGGWEREQSVSSIQGASRDPSRVQGASGDPSSIQGASRDPSRVQGASGDPSSIQGASRDHSRVQGASGDPSSIQGASRDPSRVRAASGVKVLTGSEDITKLLDGCEDISKMLEESESDTSPAKRSPANSTVLLFPGQGSQQVGMARGLLKYPNVRTMFDAAHKILGYDLLDLCLHGPQEILNKTTYCQPAVFVTSIAATEKLSHEDPTTIDNCVAVAGFSIGEFAALVFSGALDFAEALYAVKVRAEAMQRASDAVPSGMLSVVGRPRTDYRLACVEAREHCRSLGMENAVCDVANYLFPDGRVIAGNMEALEYLQKNSRKYHFLRMKMLPVSGGFHTQLMAPAMDPLQEVLKKLEFEPPYVPVYCNIDGKRYRHPSVISKLLVKQLISPIKWEQIMHTIYERKKGNDFPRTVEVGPGGQLGSILKACNLKAWHYYKNVDVFGKEESLSM